MCERIDLEKGNVTGTDAHFGSIIEVKCDIGYDLRGDSRLVCQADGQWSGNPTCISKGIRFHLHVHNIYNYIVLGCKAL